MLLVAGCVAKEQAPLVAPSPPAPVTPVRAPAPSPADEAAKLDERTAVPLLPRMANHQKAQMRDHPAAVQEVVAALGRGDLAGVEGAAARIGTSDGMERMCRDMGAGAPGFTDAALGFHRTADGIAVAARKRDRAGVASALAATLATCVGCHAACRREIVDEAAWAKRTAMAPPHAAH